MFKFILKKGYGLLANTKAGLFLLNKKFSIQFPNATSYWERRYYSQGNSGLGSYGAAAVYKAFILNKLVKNNAVNSVIEFGCGDGNQLKYYEFKSYIGLDVASHCIQKCSDYFRVDKTKK